MRKGCKMRITGFENIGNINKKAKNNYNKIIAIIIDVLYVRIGKQNAITSGKIIEKIHSELGISISPPVFRHIMHHIRTQDIMKLILSGGKGYWRAKTKKEIEDYIKSLKEREEQIFQLRTAIQNQYVNRIKEKKDE